MPSPSTRILTAPNLRWLIAETLVIVLGVLIALGLDDAWIAREQRQLEISYLERLEQEFRSDLAYIQEGFQPGVARKKAALEAVLPVIRGDQSLPEDLASFFMNISLGGILSASKRLDFASDATFEDLRSTGNMRLIRDTELRREIVDYYRGLDNEITRIAGRNTGYVQFIHGVIPAELRDDMTLETVEAMGLPFAIARLTSDEFRMKANAEYNKMLLMTAIPFEETILQMIDRVAAYRESIE